MASGAIAPEQTSVITFANGGRVGWETVLAHRQATVNSGIRRDETKR